MRPTGLTILVLLIAGCGDAPAPTPLTRAAAIDLLLSPAGPGERAPALIPGLVSEDPVVAAAARVGLRAMGRDAVPGLVQALRTDRMLIHPGDRRAMYVEAGLILMESDPGRDFGALSVLVEHITDEDFRIEQFLVLFTEPGDPDLDQAVAELAALLSHPDYQVPIVAAGTLCRLGPSASAAMPALLTTLPNAMKKNRMPLAARAAAGALANIGVATDEVITALELLLTSPYPWIAEAAREALDKLAGIEPEPAAPPGMTLEQALAGFYRRETWADARAAVTAHGAGAVPRLIEILGTGSPAKREAAAEALGLIGPGAAAAVPALIRALADEKRWVRLRVIEAVGRIGPESLPALNSLTLILDGDDAEARALAAAALADIGPEAASAVPALRRAVMTHDEDLDLVNAALRAIATMRRP